jgi:multicomponent Na+:H+ antiporter subunit E
LGRTLSLIVLLSLFWFILSGRIGVQYAIFLVGTLALVLWLNPERPFPGLDPTRGGGLRGLLLGFPRLIRYLLWLVWNIITANIEVARIILHPRMPVDPQLFRFRTELKKPFAQVVVANSITLTPGTVTVDLKDQEFLVHSLAPDSASALVGANLQNVVAAVFGESRESAPKLRTVDDADPGVFF